MPRGRQREGPLHGGQAVRVGLPELGRVAPEPVWGMAARVALAQALLGQALGHPARRPAAVALGILGLRDELVPVALAGGEDLLVGEVHGHPGRVERVLEQRR